jgi:predicted nucleotide-binding protein (sugar kinase/HSP70/actin superfamily)
MKSKWIEYKGKKILYQDFSNLFFNTKAVKEELEQVQAIVLGEPEDSVLVISDFTNTEITNELMPILNNASKTTKTHVHKTATIGVTGMKRTLGDLLSRITGQSLMYFMNEAEAKEWLTKE